ncbi:hypothetical protein PFISCL1PPCAC_16686 [Pristionchus fissidentatus]|uniref:BLOC-1-related complex subunit 6 C-terminal helix domain-containing protein n=1 Tax=Pristionchus fissidentatus TaxID=1538716 RepID=A0AAV5W696_9BILA|nr:hypothetical protein PFISCL1PPCAC_16686 [Pristionchus fissidentatus]
MESLSIKDEAGPSGAADSDTEVPSVMTTSGGTRGAPTTYIAEGLEEKIRESSRPRPRLRSSVSVDQLAHPDPKILDDLEAASRRIASNVDQVVRELRGSLHGMSDLVVEACQCYQSGISSACDQADQHIRNTYSMIAKVEELNGQLEKVSGTAGKIKEMRKIVEQFEGMFKE